MAKRSHPPTALRLAERAVRRGGLFGRGDLVLCAVSGGPDSMCLLHVLARLRRKLGHAVAAAGVDHGLREDAAQELAGARALSESLDISFHGLEVTVEKGANLQARARDARHAALQGCATRAGARCIALGHTADDRAETVLLRMLRGTGPRGLAAMPALARGIEGAVPLVRPLLSARRSDVLAHLSRHGVSFAEDPSNVDRRFLRVRVRHELMPLLEDLSPEIVTHLCSLADMVGDLVGPEADIFASLGRAQRQELERTLKEGLRGASQAITLRLRGGRELLVDFRRQSRRQKSETGPVETRKTGTGRA